MAMREVNVGCDELQNVDKVLSAGTLHSSCGTSDASEAKPQVEELADFISNMLITRRAVLRVTTASKAFELRAE